MREWVVKLLGGYSWQQFDSYRQELDKQLIYARDLVDKKDAEIARLSNLIFARAGFIINEQQVAVATKHEPINSRPSWKQIQRNLEREDARKLADQIERHWKNKPGAVPVGAGDNESLLSGDSKHTG